jgi:hypothetical protein
MYAAGDVPPPKGMAAALCPSCSKSISQCHAASPKSHFPVRPVFAHGAGFGIEMVQALDAAHAKDITRAQHPTGRLSAVPAELLDGQDRHRLLVAWLRAKS